MNSVYPMSIRTATIQLKKMRIVNVKTSDFLYERDFKLIEKWHEVFLLFKQIHQEHGRIQAWTVDTQASFSVRLFGIPLGPCYRCI